MINWLEVIENNQEKLQEVAEQAFRDAINNRHMRFIVEISEDGECYSWGDVAGGNTQTVASWKGKSYEVGEFCFQYIDIPITEEDLRRNMTREKQTEVEAEAEEWGESFLDHAVYCRDVVNACEEEYLSDYAAENVSEEADSLIERCLENLRMEERMCRNFV